MKNLILTAGLTLSVVIQTSAQNTYAWPSTGNIGIGTNTPNARRAVVGAESQFTNNSYSDPVNGISFGIKVGGGGIAVRGNGIFVDGKVGIGTTTPTELLSVNGNIRAREIKVEINNWPDYVFEDKYDLMPLNTLNEYVKRYKHLPEVLTSKEIDENGMNVGEINRLLVRKVEELTLYLIELDTKYNTLKNKVDAISTKL